MAASNGEGRKTFFTIVGGRFAKRVEADVEGAVPRTLKNGKDVHELLFGELSGTIDKIEVKDSEWGQNIDITLTDGDTLSLMLDSAVGGIFCKILPNVDEKYPVSFKTWMDDDGKTAFTVVQKDQYIKWAFTRDNPNGMPEATKKMVAGKEKWDFDAQKEFLYNSLIKQAERFKSQFDTDVPDKLQGIIPAQEAEPEEEIPVIDIGEEDDVVDITKIDF